MPRTSQSTYIAFLRGINVGGKNILPMAKLTAIFGKAGCVKVQTYIQSGNVIFSADEKCAAEISTTIPSAIAKAFDFQPAVIIRSAKELKHAAEANPFPPTGAAPLHVGFLASAPDAKNIALLDTNRSPGDFFHITGREIYLSLASGMGKTKLTNAYFAAKLQTLSTFRNWRTVLKLVEMTTSV